MNWKNALASLSLGAAILAGASCGESKQDNLNSNQGQAHYEPDVVNNAVLSYMVGPMFASDDFTKQVTGTNVELEKLARDGNLYFTIPSKDYVKGQTLDSLTSNPSKVEFAKLVNGRLELGNFSMGEPGRHLFRFPRVDFSVDPNNEISIPFDNVTYTQNLEDLTGFIMNGSIYGGHVEASIHSRLKIANHSVLIAVPGEPSLTRLAEELTASSVTKEDEAQKLLDFVTTNLSYNGVDASFKGELLRRPNETIMSRGSDCSNLATTYASLLGQRDIPHVLAYYQGHIAVGVEGSFTNYNGLSFNYGDKRLSIAETTVPGFTIGETVGFDSIISPEKITYIQEPGRNTPIVDIRTGKPLEFN